jgi:hypothetical protein
VNEFSYTT